ncbi:MAG: hypothetical protein ACQEXQ_10185 [Bacillota bacterium]
MTNPYPFTQVEQDLVRNNFDFIDSKLWSKTIFTDLQRKIRRYLLILNNKKCFYCKTELVSGTNTIPIEHIVDKGKHPLFTFEPHNLTISCNLCNSGKGTTEILCNPNITVYPYDDKDAFKIIHAYYDTYESHIRIDGNFLHVGLSEKGHNTIEICKLFRSKLAEEKLQNYRLSISKESELLMEKLTLTNDPNEISRIIDLVSNILDRLTVNDDTTRLFALMQQEENILLNVEKIRSKRVIAQIIDNISDVQLSYFEMFIRKIDLMKLIKKLISDRTIKTILDVFILQDGITNITHSHRFNKIRTIIENNVNNSEHDELFLQIKNRYFYEKHEIETEIANSRDILINLYEVEKMLSLIFKIRQNTSIKLLDITDHQKARIIPIIDRVLNQSVSESEKSFAILIRKIFIIRDMMIRFSSQNLLEYRDVVVKLIS